jgi:hypothetical protein
MNNTDPNLELQRRKLTTDMYHRGEGTYDNICVSFCYPQLSDWNVRWEALLIL